MAVHSRHPAGEVPTAPPRKSTTQLLLQAYTVFLLFIALATTAWYNLLGPAGLVVLVLATTLVSIVLWAVLHPMVAWRRLPAFAIAYVVWAGASVVWTHWLDATILTWSLLAATTIQGLFVASVRTWHEIVRAIASALRWLIGLSALFEVWVWFFVGRPVLPLVPSWEGEVVKELYWSRANLFDWDARIQGIVGNAHLLGIAALLALIVFGVRIASRAPGRGWLIAWMVLSAFLLWRASSATVWLAVAAVVVVLGTVLLMRTTRRAGERTKWYALYAATGIGLAGVVWIGGDAVLQALGRSSDLTERTRIWEAVWERVHQHPVLGWGYSTPWLPWEPDFADWIIVNDLPVFHAHNMWLDVLFQLGWIGVALLILVYFAFVWRSWFFAVDRPRWDLVGDRPYQALTVLPTLVATVLLVQGIAESRPLQEWGWMFVVMLGMKIKQSPLVGEGPAEQRLAMERGERLAGTR